MTHADYFGYIDHTLLRATATWAEIQTLCEEAVRYKTASVCVPPSYVARIHAAYPALNICTVIGFPLGYSTTAAKVFETREAIESGASEVDMVVNLADVKNGDFDSVTREIAVLREASKGHILKVIVETCYLTEEEKVRLCGIVTETGADFIKTSTGFGTGGATLEDIRLFKKHIGPNVRMKASGGVKTVDDLAAFIGEGCARIGTSSAVKLLAK